MVTTSPVRRRALTTAEQSLVVPYYERTLALADRTYNRRFRHTNVTPNEIVSAALLGLLDAARLFDPTRGLQFWTYATHRIYGAIQDEIRELRCQQGYQNRGQQQLCRFIQETTTHFDSRQVRSLELYNDASSRIGPEALYELRDELRHLRRFLSWRDRIIVVLYFLEEYSMREVGQAMSLSESSISIILQSVLGRMREHARHRTIRAS